MMARAGQVLSAVVDELKAACREGLRTIELDRLADRRIRAAGARPGFLGYHGFPKSICVSINDEAVHGIPGKRKIEDGDIVSLAVTWVTYPLRFKGMRRAPASQSSGSSSGTESGARCTKTHSSRTSECLAPGQ